MTTDNPQAESGALDANQAADAFSTLFGGEAAPNTDGANESPEAAAERLAAAELAGAGEGDPPQPSAGDQNTYTVRIDGKDVPVTLDELRNGYQRQQDYTRKTMDAAEVRKAAETEFNTARAERQQYVNQLQSLSQQLQGVLQDQSQTNWQQLLETDPVEYLKQQHLYQQRQATLQQTQREQQALQQQHQAEQDKRFTTYKAEQNQALLDKLPDWKDETKAAAEKTAIAQDLLARGFSVDELKSLTDHRLILELRDAVKYRQLIAKAKAATNKVATLPAKVERPGNAEASKVDGRSAVMQRFNKSGSLTDAAAAFASIL